MGDKVSYENLINKIDEIYNNMEILKNILLENLTYPEFAEHAIERSLSQLHICDSEIRRQKKSEG